jgi:hypothetical protein
MLDQGLGGWFGRQAANFFFDLPTFWTKNGLEAPPQATKPCFMLQNRRKGATIEI